MKSSVPARALAFTLAATSIAALLLCLTLLAARGRAAWRAQASEPGTAETSGCEQAGWFTLWRATRDIPIYANSSAPPYAGAYFNWLFYRANTALLPRFASGHAVIVTGRAFTLGSALLGAACCAAWAVSLFRTASFAWRTWAASIAAMLFVGPVVGWWSLTVRPDISALLAETFGVLFFISLRRRLPVVATVGAALLFYLAWAFKPNVVTALASCGVFLLARRAWRDALLLATITGGLVLLTFVVAGPGYVAQMRETVGSSEFYAVIALGNARYAFVGAVYLVALLPAIWFARNAEERATPHEATARDALHFSLLGLGLATAAAFVMSAKVGASRNYFFTPVMFATIALLAAMRRRPQARLAIACALIACCVPLVVLSGRAGAVSLDSSTVELQRRWQLWQTLPEPRYSADPLLNAPWLNPASPPLDPSFHYWDHRRAGRPFVAGGIGGHIARREFAALLLPADTTDHYDGAPLRDYKRGRTVANMTEFLRIPPLSLP